MEIIVEFMAVVKVELQPSVVTGSFTALGLGCPKPIHNAMDKPVAKPLKAPFKKDESISKYG